MTTTEGVWLSISDYSRYKNVSISTIRRHIKSKILKHREENGKYFIYVPSVERVKVKEEEEILRARLEIELLRTQIRQLKEENSELKMLVELYEGSQNLPPSLPEINL
jgi:homoserine trans-succinylase